MFSKTYYKKTDTWYRR